MKSEMWTEHATTYSITAVQGIYIYSYARSPTNTDRLRIQITSPLFQTLIYINVSFTTNNIQREGNRIFKRKNRCKTTVSTETVFVTMYKIEKEKDILSYFTF